MWLSLMRHDLFYLRRILAYRMWNKCIYIIKIVELYLKAMQVIKFFGRVVIKTRKLSESSWLETAS